jgi:hypothetical protein
MDVITNEDEVVVVVVVFIPDVADYSKRVAMQGLPIKRVQKHR